MKRLPYITIAIVLACVSVVAVSMPNVMPDSLQATQGQQEALTAVQEGQAPVLSLPDPLWIVEEGDAAEREQAKAEIEMMAKVVWAEARGCPPEEQRLVIWTVLQRVDAGGFGETIADVIRAPKQFAYRENAPIDEEISRRCATEIAAWRAGSAPPTHEIYAPTLPYLFFEGDGQHNWFRAEWK